MPLLSPAQRAFCETVALLDFANPFLPERTELERAALGAEFVDLGPYGSASGDADPNVERLEERAQACLRSALQRFEDGVRASAEELALYENLALFHLYHRYRPELVRAIEESARRGSGRCKIRFYDRYSEEARRILRPSGRVLPGDYDPAHLFSFFFQICRAFYHIGSNVIGSSEATVRLRSSIWQSIFTHDLRRYARSLFGRMSDVSTLVMGPSGTGKELVARAIGLSGYIPFDAETAAFTECFIGVFLPLNLSALSPTLIESELFGHSRGAFTGAVKDRAGWFETCSAHGTVFLDEIGEIDRGIQVKLLRVLQTRLFQRLGDTQERRFEGRIVCATNRDLTREMQRGTFREDLYYRICSDIIVTPSLAEQTRGATDELHHLVLHVARRLAGDEAEDVAAEVMEWIEGELGADYDWPGNFRELEQCVRNVLVRKEYRPVPRESPASPASPVSTGEELVRDVLAGELSADELLRRYCTLVYARTGSYEGAARRLGLDRRTVKARVDPELLDRLR